MKASSALWAASILAASSVSALPAAADLEARQNNVMITTGATNGIHTRLEIHTMHQNFEQWSLFIVALQQFQNLATSQKNSYWQIAGIHGVPFQSYDNVDGDCSGGCASTGYCTHNIVLFPAWHRAYLALWEQNFLAVVNNVVNQYQAGAIRNKMKAAAATMRWPYWDWAANPDTSGNVAPYLLTNTTLLVHTPTGQKYVSNPLVQYKIPNGKANTLNYPIYEQWPYTLRWPSDGGPTANSRENYFSYYINDGQRKSFQKNVYNMLSSCHNYLGFSNAGGEPDNCSNCHCDNSIEDIHNNVHTLVGGYDQDYDYGHMAIIDVAALDPIFFLHHANVDRLFALWQRLNPGVYGGSQIAGSDTWEYSAGSTQNETSPLYPFRKDASRFWTTNDVQNWDTTFNYTYPEFADSDGSAASINRYVNALYGPGATATVGSSKRTAVPEPVVAAAAASATASLSSPLHANNGSAYQYLASVRTPQYTLGGTYSISLFFGEPASETPTSWIDDPNNVGYIAVLSMPGMTDNEHLTKSSVSLTTALAAKQKAGQLKDLSVASVVPYMRKNLNWRIAGPKNANIDPASLKGFELGVFGSTSTPIKSDEELPKWSPRVPLYAVTEGRDGGAGPLSSVWTAAKQVLKDVIG